MKNLKKNKGWSATDVLTTAAIASVIVLLTYPFYQRTKINADMQQLSVSIHQIHKVMKDIYLDQNPNQYPPDNVWPNGLTGWATPTNLQNVENLKDLMKQLCLPNGNGNFPGGKGSYHCYYKHRGTPGALGEDYDLLITNDDVSAGSSKGFNIAYTTARDAPVPTLDDWENPEHWQGMGGQQQGG